MSLMVWFRKYNKKIMAVVVIALMIVFTIQPVMDYFSSTKTGEGKVVAYYGNGKKISRQDISLANQQIEILRAIGIEQILQPEDPRLGTTQDLRIALLGELIFPERSSAVESISRIKQIVSMDNYSVSDKQINEIYSKQHPASIYWLLLTREAHEAGVRTPVESSKSQLEILMPRLNRGATYAQIIGVIEKRNRVSEKQVLEAFSDMTSVIEYCRTICATENRTIQQVLNRTNLRLETIDVNYVVCGADTFVDESFKPTAGKMEEQFEKYKGNFAGEAGEDNPYGFGYKLPDRVRLEYIAVRLDDVASIVKPLTQQEVEEYYQQHLSQPPIAYAARLDPNDPNSELVRKTRSYAEVASVISKGLYQQRVDSKAERILLDAKSIAEVNLSGIEAEQSKLTDEQIKKGSVGYSKVAAELSEKYKIRVYADRTGLLSPSDIQSDKNLAPLYVGGAGVAESSLLRVAFAVEQLKASELGPLDVKAPRLYENIGPLKDAREGSSGYTGKNMMLVRIVAAEKAVEPKNISEKIDNHSVRFDSQAAEDSNTVRELVIQDLKRLAAMDKAKSKAQEFVALAAKDGWKDAVDKFNRTYGKSKDESDTISGKGRTFTLNTQSRIRRINNLEIENLMARYEGNPMVRILVSGTKREGMLIDKFYALVPADSNTLAKPGTIVEYKPGMCYYCLESMTIHRLYQEGLDMTKAAEVVRDEFVDSQALAFIYYNPKDILKRMKFVEIQEQQDVAEPNSIPADNNRTDK